MGLAHACNARIATSVRAIGFILSAAILQCPAEGLAQSGPITRFFIGASAGGPVEAYARIVGDHMSKTLGQTIIYETRPGANGNVGAQAVLDQPADGHSVWVATQSMLEINPSVYEGLRWKPSDFRPLIKGVEAPIALVVNLNVPAKTLDELVGWVKKNPGTLSFTSYSPGTPLLCSVHRHSSRQLASR